MAATSSPVALGWPAAAVDLPGIDGKRHTLASARGRNGLLVMFICNHCPYVRAVAAKIVRDTDALAELGIGSIAIMSSAYDAVCTPDFFGFDRDLALAYHGRLDASGRNSDPNAARELIDAMSAVARGGRAPLSQTPSIGCSIKWRAPS